jgi:quinol monooxygenase YgiN
MALAYFVNFTVTPENIEKTKELSLALQEKTKLEPGCRQYAFHQCVEEPTRFFIYEVYNDMAALETHRATPHFQKLVKEGMWPITETHAAHACTPL